ncbi:hypothetical protein WAI453_011561 [Rhynchosporium graminicola]
MATHCVDRSKRSSNATSLSGDDYLQTILEPEDEDESYFSLDNGPSSGATTPRQHTMKEVQVPQHPVPSMQAAFAESMLESSTASTPTIPKNRIADAAARRKSLIDQDVDDDTHAARWKQKPGQQHHELWKLMAQISFGVYLLINGIAKDDGQVMSILQGHVDEVDEFLETTLEDFNLAQEDIEERLKFLKLPLENIIIFDAMLEDRDFRLQIVNGNERIEHVIIRTAKAMNDALRDVRQGLDACKEFTIYLAEEQENFEQLSHKPDTQKVFLAMKGNVEGWFNAYVSLQTKGADLGVALVQLGSIVAEMDRRAGEVSRRTIYRSASSPEPLTINSPPDSPESKLMRQSMYKDLPSDPDMITPAIRATLPAFRLVQDRQQTPEPEPESYSEEEKDSEDEHEAEEPAFTLKPTTYTPVPSPLPSPRPPLGPVQAPPSPPPEIQRPSPENQQAPEVKKRSSLRKRFSLGKKKEKPQESMLQAPPPIDTYWAARQRVTSSQPTPRARQSSVLIEQNSVPRPSEGQDVIPSDTQNSFPTAVTRERQASFPQEREKRLSLFSKRQKSNPNLGERQKSVSSEIQPSIPNLRERRISIPHGRGHQTLITTSPSRGLDSAYCSDFDQKKSPQDQNIIQPHFAPLTQTTSHQSGNTNDSQSNIRPQFARDFSSPRSDQQFFRPVQASPHSPLQRPWTAGPSNPLHMHSNSSNSNLSFHTSYTSQTSRDFHHSRVPSQLAHTGSYTGSGAYGGVYGGNRRGSPSTMGGQSVKSEMTTMTEIDGNGERKKVKKKRSAFGWLKKAFSLSEEERAEFERKRMRDEAERREYYAGSSQGQGGGQRARWVDGRRVG